MDSSPLRFDCILYNIVKRLPIRDLLQVGLVSERWHTAQQKVLLTVSSIRIDIKSGQNKSLFERPISPVKAHFYHINEPHRVMAKFGEDDLNRSTYDLVVTKDSVQALSTLFPNIKRLTLVAFDWSLNMPGLWPNLTELTMVAPVYANGRERIRLSGSINELKSLKVLAVDLPLYQLSLSIYGQLEKLTCRLQEQELCISERRVQLWSDTIIDKMTRYPNIVTMGLWVEWACGQVDYSNWPSQVTNRITRLVHLDEDKPGQASSLDVIRDKFDSLTYLHLRGRDMALP